MKCWRTVALVGFLISFGVSLYALTNVTTGNLVISGTVPQAVYLSVSATQVHVQANQGSESPISVTELIVKSTGYWAISIESKNKGYLLNTLNPQARIHYLFTLGILTPSPQDLGSPWMSEARPPTTKAGSVFPLDILLQTGGQMIDEGVYEDLLTIDVKQF